MIILIICMLVLIIISFVLGYKINDILFKISENKKKKNFNDKYNIKL